MTIKSVQLALAVVPLVLAPLAQASLVTALKHVTDGTFNGGTTSEAPEWSGPNVAKQSFAIAGDGSGGSTLYVEQGSGSQLGMLFLMYDYTNSSQNTGRFFDVFFQDRVTNQDYGIRILGTTFQAYEKPFGPPSALTPMDRSLSTRPHGRR
jgi:hypothetical protein